MPLAAIFLLLLLIAAFAVGLLRGGIKVHLAYFFVLGVYSIYLLISPLYFYGSGLQVFHDGFIWPYYERGFFLNALAVLCFSLGYWLVPSQVERQFSQPKRLLSGEKSWISLLFFGVFGIVLLNMFLGGINIVYVFLGNQQVGLGARGLSYYLQNFVDSGISVLVLGMLFGVSRRKLLVGTAFAFFIYLLLGFRYRIILTVFGFAIALLYKNRLTPRLLAAGAVGMLAFFYLTLFITHNRMELLRREYHALEYNPATFDPGTIFDQTRGALADLAILRGFEEKGLEHDYGVTTLFYPFIRLIPRAIFPNKDDYYPPPQLATTIKAYDVPWAAYLGEATTNIGTLYIHFGSWGVIIGNLLMGLLLKWFNNSINFRSTLSVGFNIIVTISLFQWITRGYFPQYVDTLAYMIFPPLVLLLLARKGKSV